jgi:hypothetical protein
MARHSRPQGRSPSVATPPPVGHRPEDDRLNQRIADSMRDAAEAREARSQETSAQDASANKRLQVALRALIDGRPS